MVSAAPVRLVTARLILLAGPSHFLANASFRQAHYAAGLRTGLFLERWISALPPHARS